MRFLLVFVVLEAMHMPGNKNGKKKKRVIYENVQGIVIKKEAETMIANKCSCVAWLFMTVHDRASRITKAGRVKSLS